ncbi:MAG: glycoside hydrolase family 130 protein [Verrucomicrobia bacterium]|nr:glycoside hydrolase family 130 protein [Verrucomicrobiota bacterium]
MLRRLRTTCVIGPSGLDPSRDGLQVVGVFNPGAAAFGDGVVLMVRVAERSKERRAGFTALPRWETGVGIVIDWVPDVELRPLDARVVERKADGLVRLTFTSHLRVLFSPDGRTIDSAGAWFAPQGEYEEFGVEDARITRIEDTYWITYVAVSRHGAATALASTREFREFERHGIIFCPENKDVVLFPERIGGEYVALHRPNAATPFTKPEMWIARSSDLIHWGRHECIHAGAAAWEAGRIGAGAPPIRTPDGWLEIYHGNRKAQGAEGVGVYSAGALLLSLDDPRHVVARAREPIMEPELDFERDGFVSNVVFPTGIVARGETYQIFYGAADRSVGLLEVARHELLKTLLRTTDS